MDGVSRIAGTVGELGILRLVATPGGVHTPCYPIAPVVAVWHDVLYLSRTGLCERVSGPLEGFDRVHGISLVPVVPVLVGRVYEGG